MDAKIITDQKTIAKALVEVIATFDITKVADLLNDDGEYCIQNEKNEIIPTSKTIFLNWLENCIDDFF
jgi:hypothetical protein